MVARARWGGFARSKPCLAQHSNVRSKKLPENEFRVAEDRAKVAADVVSHNRSLALARESRAGRGWGGNRRAWGRGGSTHAGGRRGHGEGAEGGMEGQGRRTGRRRGEM